MYIEFKPEWEDKLKEIAESEALKSQLSMYRYRDSCVNIEFRFFSRKELDTIYSLAKDSGDRSIMMQISAYTKYLDNPKAAKISGIKPFAAILRDYIHSNAVNHWVFVVSKEYSLPYLVTGVKYEEPRDKSDQASVSLSLCANSIERTSRSSVTFYSGDVQGKTIEQVLTEHSIIVASEELVDEFNADMETFFVERKKHNSQYRVNGIGICYSHYWRDTTQEIKNQRAINDEAINKRSFTFKYSTAFWTSPEETITFDIPSHPFIYMYNLDTYENFYIHIRSIKAYEYDDTLRDKLILPESHRDLLDILTNDMDILKGDIIEGKSLGTTILCTGKPGLGKTLTAEVYSEITHKALYKVNSGQLGVTPEDVEKNLEDILSRAQRWGAVMLIDEADTYIRARDNDMNHNAIVAAFLRTLEYFHGLLFLTTNRGDDVDDAIISRCIATIKYQTPTSSAAKRIWEVLSTEFKVPLSETLIDTLVKTFPESSGRDIRELLRLTARFIKAKSLDVSLEAFMSCAQFRGLTVDSTQEVKNG